MSNNDQFDDLDDFDDFDEISDEIEAVPESAAAEEDWDQFNEDENPESETQDKPSKKTSGKKKSGLFNLLLVGGIILAGGGFMFLQTAGKRGAAPTQVPLEEPVIEDQIAEMPDPPTAPPMPSPIVQPEAEPEIMQQATAPVPNLPDTQPSAEEETALRMPKAEDILLKSAPESVSENPVIQPSPEPEAIATAPSVPAVPVTPVADNQELNQLMNRLDALSTRLESLETKLETYRAEIPQASESSATGEQIRVLQQSLARLEERLDQGVAIPSVAVAEPERQAVAPRPLAKPVPQILGQNSSAKDVNEGSEFEPQKPTPAVVKIEWVLKGAQPGRAMVARRGETDLQAVEVGDTLPGIGRITSIEYRNGKWFVTGTSGAISQ